MDYLAEQTEDERESEENRIVEIKLYVCPRNRVSYSSVRILCSAALFEHEFSSRLGSGV
jgi:hypothetical protein